MKRLTIFATYIVASLGLLVGFTGVAAADTIVPSPITFETTQGYSVGSINTQNSWMETGSFDASVASVADFAAASGYGFGDQALRISDAVTSGSFGDQTFSPGLGTVASESTTQRHFEASFQIGTALADVQSGLHMSVSPDDGLGARMSYLRFEDQADGVHVFFSDVTDPGPFGTTANFNQSQIAILPRTAAHTIKFSLDLFPGAANDVVRIYIDGGLVKTGTTWEDYYRYDAEQIGSGNVVPTVDKLLLRESGTPTPANAGNGFLIDSVTLASSASTSACVFSTANSTETLLADCTTDHTILVPQGFTLDGAGHTITAVDPTGGHFVGAVVKNGGTVANVNNVTITASNLAIVCDAGNDRLRGILFDGASGSITNNSVTELEQGPTGESGCQEGNGIDVRTSGTVTISGNRVIDYQKTGILATGLVTATITNNTVTGDGPITYIGQNGIQISYGATAKLTGNAVTANIYSPAKVTACGLLIYKAGGVSASKSGISYIKAENTITNNETDICNFGKGGGFDPTS